MKKIVYVFLAGVLLSACSSKPKEAEASGDELTGEIQLSGAFALYPMAVKWTEEFKKIHPNVRFDVSGGGAGKGMTDALAGVVDIGMVSRELHAEEVAKGALGFATVKDAVIPTINAENPDLESLLKIGLKKDVAKKLWNEELKTWGEVVGTSSKTPVHVFTRSDACGAAETFAAWFDVKQENLVAAAIFGDPGIADAVRKDKVGIGYNNISYAYDQNSKKPFEGLAIIPLDVNENGQIDPEEDFYQTSDELIAAINDGRFPSPPARDLYLVTKGRPTKPEVIEFLKYVLSDGQQFAEETGYIGLSADKLAQNLQKLQ
ncbi:Phosphate-binding protein pstS precursor [Bacteroidales bacterium Barb7]|nr:Phosphate-binding protein pstS precursor [Bacteroidales bacterium Barb4]OAV75398.1 Phosphate-binding protein pstS precursor [Bacteroidales bacterium Barb7]